VNPLKISRRRHKMKNVSIEIVRGSIIELVPVKVSRVTELALRDCMGTELAIEMVNRIKLYAMAKYGDRATGIYYEDVLLAYV